MSPRRIINLLLVMVLFVSSPGWSAASGKAGFPETEITPTSAPPPPGSLTAQVDKTIDLNAVLSTRPFSVHFSSAMDPSSADPALVSYPYLPGTLTWSDAGKTLTFQPEGGFLAGRVYHIYLDSTLKSLEGHSFAEIQQWQIQVKPGPRLKDYTPLSDELTTLQPVIKLTFDGDMDPGSLAEALSIQPAVPFKITWDKQVASIAFDQLLTPGDHYHLTISRRAVDTVGTPLDRDYAWDYWIAPLRMDAAAKNEREFDLTVNYDLDLRSSGATFEINPPVEGTWTWAGVSKAHFSAKEFIPAGRPYAVRLKSVQKDLQGFSLADLKPAQLMPQPLVRMVTPNANTRDTTPGYVSMAFVTPMNHVQTEAAFNINPSVPGKFAWSDNTLTFTPDQSFASNTHYTVSLETSAVDQSGRTLLLEPYTWSFETGYYYYQDTSQSAINFGRYGLNAQIVDLNGRRSIQFVGDSGSKITFALYHIKPEEFMPIFKARLKTFYSGQAGLAFTGDELRGMQKVTEWSQTLKGGIEETLLPAQVPGGTYVLAASANGKLTDELFVVMTQNTLVVKLSNDRLWVWATKINGANVPNLPLKLYMQDGSIMREGKTGEDGIFTTTLPKDIKPFMVVAMGEGEDITLSGVDNEWQTYLSGTYACCGWGNAEPSPVFGGYLYTDRPIYRPGQVVSFKGIFRVDDDARYSLPAAGTPVKVTLLDSRDNQVQSLDLTLNDMGTLNGTFQLADGAMLGDYNIQAELDKRVFKQAFKVQDYHKPDFQVSLTTDKPYYASTDKVKLDIDTRYFFDQPVSQASLYVNFYSLGRKYNDYSWWDDIQVGAPLPKGQQYTWLAVADNPQASLSADQDGRQSYTFMAQKAVDSFYNCRSSWSTTLRECLVGVEVTAEDGSGQMVTASQILRVYNDDKVMSVDAGSWQRQVGETFNVTARVTDLNGQPVANYKLSLLVRGWQDFDFTRNETSLNLTTGADGKAIFPIKINQKGYYRLQLTEQGVSIDSQQGISDWVYVTDKTSSQNTADWGNFTISAEHSRYKPYDKASLMITSSFDGPALLTFERGHVIYSKPIMLTAPLTQVDEVIIPEDVPNVFVTVNAWREQSTKPEPGNTEGFNYQETRANSHLYTSNVELQVDATDKRLNVTITPDRKDYQPRQEAVFNIQVTDAQGQPAEAELSAALVDEAIFSLSEDLARPIFEAFYRPRPLSVNTYNSLQPSRILIDYGGQGGGGGQSLTGNPRSSFPDTAAWIPVVKTDQNGQAKISIPLPDSLTTWRLTIKAATAGTRVGEAAAKIVTRQEITLQPLPPAGLTVGDEIMLPVLVRNDGTQPRDLSVTFKGDGLELKSADTQKIALKPGGSTILSWKVTAHQPGKTQFTVVAAAQDSAGDAIQLPLEVNERSLPEVDNQSGEFTRELTTTIVLPASALPSSTAELRLSRSISSNLMDGLDYLTGYPYGCVEQTMSRALPNAVVGRALSRLGINNPGLEKTLPELINAGLQRLYGYQHEDGGWGWWLDDNTDAYQTAWVLFGLSTTGEAGYPVDRAVIKRGADYLGEQVKQTPDARLKAYMLYALAYAGYGDHETTLGMVENVYQLDAFSQAALALALHHLGSVEQARSVLAILDSTAMRSGNQISWPSAAEDGQYHSKTMSSTLRTTALALEAYVQIDPRSAAIPATVRYLMSQRRPEGWSTTNETAYTLLALTDYLLANQQAEGDARYKVLLNNQVVAEGTLKPGEGPAKLTLPFNQMKKGANVLKIQHEGDGLLYFSFASHAYLNLPSVPAAGVVAVKREYLDPQTRQPITMALSGDLVRVRLTVSVPGSRASYVMVEDHLPAGFEALNEALNNTAHDPTLYRASQETGAPYYLWQQYGYNYKEIRGSRVTFFITEFDENGQGVQTFEYLARANHVGTFSALPAEVVAMYDETLWGRSNSSTMTVLAKEP